MIEVGIGALKARLSELVGRAANDETIIVTDRGKPVAQLVQYRASELPPRLAELVRQGQVTLADGPPRRTKPRAKMKPGSSLTDILIAERRHERLL